MLLNHCIFYVLITEVNYRDYRAWYGLGQTYEILKMPSYCLYYYRQAHKFRYVVHLACSSVFIAVMFWRKFSKVCFVFGFRPNDSRMLVALGESYEKLNSMQQAKKVSSIWWWERERLAMCFFARLLANCMPARLSSCATILRDCSQFTFSATHSATLYGPLILEGIIRFQDPVSQRLDNVIFSPRSDVL